MIQPVKKALGGDPEAIQTRAVLTKYRAQLSAAVADATARAAKRYDSIRLGVVGLGWVGLGWVGLGWVGLGWVGLGWVGLGWVGLGWFGMRTVRYGTLRYGSVRSAENCIPGIYSYTVVAGESPTYILDEDTQPVIRAIGVSHTHLANMSFDKIFDLTAGIYFHFYDIYIEGEKCDVCARHSRNFERSGRCRVLLLTETKN